MNKQKNSHIYSILMVIIILFSTGFIAFMGYMNFKTTYQEITDQTYGEIADELVDQIEVSLNFGKTLDNYYGMTDIFQKYQNRMGIDKELFVLNTSDELLYSTFEDQEYLVSEVQHALEDRNFISAKENGNDQSKSVKIRNKNYLILPIESEEENIGYFVVLYDSGSLAPQLEEIKHRVFAQTGVCMALVVILYLLGVFVVSRLKVSKEAQEKTMKVYPIVLLMAGIIIQSVLSLNVYQQSYRDNMLKGAEEIMENMEETISEVMENGVDISEAEGVSEYLCEKVENIPILWNIKIAKEVADASAITKRDSSMLLHYDLADGDLLLEAELSNRYINEIIFQIVLVLLSTLIIMIIFIIEIMKLPRLLVYRMSGRTRQACDESYVQVGNALRLSSFLCSTAEYICVPYAAMLIRQWNEPVFGLSVGMTAALPLSLEGFTQMIAMLVLPKYVRKINIKAALTVSTIAMMLCNVGAFFANGALMIILMRGAAGIAYAGFKQISNYLITRGYENELQRSNNLSQDNAGLLAGVTCGAGLGAIICETAGYSMTFLLSVLVFAAYLLVTLVTVPWKVLEGNQLEEEEEKVGFREIIRMIFSWEVIKYILVVGIPLNIGILLCVTLVPGICQSNGISTVFLSYCYIVNGIAGIYIGPNLVNMAKKYFGLKKSISFAFILTAVSLFILELPPVVIMIMVTSMILGFLDGFATPLTMDAFMDLSVVKRTVSESTALIFSVVLSYVLTTVGPMVAETMLIQTKFVITPLMIGALVYAAAAVILFGESFMKKKKK